MCTCNEGPAGAFQCKIHGCNHHNLVTPNKTKTEKLLDRIQEEIEEGPYKAALVEFFGKEIKKGR